MKTQPKKCNTRHLEIKTSLNVDEFQSFKSVCQAAGVAVATRIRVLINRDADMANRSSADRRRERPKFGRVRVELPAARGRMGGAPMPRPRL
ncbi:hypothetical protein GJ699_02410 [Duganella sp. FT80W]|uniref:Uncharacterized protein n=1 Tax=Duganella guangzhouensis TaxID=2666084 RepID=A0A6I2KSX5_9BURK|nr:hypothetical protein [Duganella guangzhouensis]MRW88833.1 hypothetical protein [Duganella guangzhouensis]